MIAYQTTQKNLKATFKRIISVADIGFLFEYYERFAYNSGICGWNFDAFDINGVCFCKGYRTIGEKPNFIILREYEEKAKKVYFSISDIIERKDAINALLFEMCEKLLS